MCSFEAKVLAGGAPKTAFTLDDIAPHIRALYAGPIIDHPPFRITSTLITTTSVLVAGLIWPLRAWTGSAFTFLPPYRFKIHALDLISLFRSLRHSGNCLRYSHPFWSFTLTLGTIVAVTASGRSLKTGHLKRTWRPSTTHPS